MNMEAVFILNVCVYYNGYPLNCKWLRFLCCLWMHSLKKGLFVVSWDMALKPLCLDALCACNKYWVYSIFVNRKIREKCAFVCYYLPET